MSDDDWKVGDHAVCIADGWYCHRCHKSSGCADVPALNVIYRVTALSMAVGELMLEFAEFERGQFHHSGFRKIRPDTEPAADEGWVEQLQHFRRTVPA